MFNVVSVIYSHVALPEMLLRYRPAIDKIGHAPGTSSPAAGQPTIPQTTPFGRNSVQVRTRYPEGHNFSVAESLVMIRRQMLIDGVAFDAVLVRLGKLGRCGWSSH